MIREADVDGDGQVNYDVRAFSSLPVNTPQKDFFTLSLNPSAVFLPLSRSTSLRFEKKERKIMLLGPLLTPNNPSPFLTSPPSPRFFFKKQTGVRQDDDGQVIGEATDEGLCVRLIGLLCGGAGRGRRMENEEEERGGVGDTHKPKNKGESEGRGERRRDTRVFHLSSWLSSNLPSSPSHRSFLCSFDVF